MFVFNEKNVPINEKVFLIDGFSKLGSEKMDQYDTFWGKYCLYLSLKN